MKTIPEESAAVTSCRPEQARPSDSIRVVTSGKFLRRGGEKFYVKGFSYGPFAPNRAGEHLPEPEQVERDFKQVKGIGANTVRVYFPPPVWLLDIALKEGLMVFIDIPWEKHRCFLEDWYAMERARDVVRKTARELGQHPAVLAISVVNEIPADVVRFQGRKRVARFIEELIGIARTEAPDCLVTFVNFPTTEFLEVKGCDFTCFNVYVHDEVKFGRYLDRLQHIAGNKPLVLGEYGIDSLRESEEEQAHILARHLGQVFRHGLAGSVVFAYTDDWFTGGQQITDWFFGVTRVDRSEKPAVTVLRELWAKVPNSINTREDLPKVSVVVCTYNGSRTLQGCLESLRALDYPDYEVIIVDDGSTDGVCDIAARYPVFRYFRQKNRGLSVARNVGAQLAAGTIVAYTDDDCVVDEHWLRYLVQAMEDQQVEGIGGPNITPESDGWTAKCVAASPGNPSHVMIDDHRAEHIPGCNMAFKRDILLGIGGFDGQYRVAGDDVDFCWRLQDAGYKIGYAPGAMVWHHRRSSVKAYKKQQKGYGRSESMVQFKHPGRFGSFGNSRWWGVIYGDGAVGLPLQPPRIYHGRFGTGLFQTIYRHNEYGSWWIMMSLEWHFAALFCLALGTIYWAFALPAIALWGCTLGLVLHSTARAPLPREAPIWCRPLVGYLYLMQPVWRGWTRLTHSLRNRRYTKMKDLFHGAEIKRVKSTAIDLYWDSDCLKGREELLPALARDARLCNWKGDFDNAWAEWDVKLYGDEWHEVIVRAATEELGWPRRFTRVRCEVRTTWFQQAIASACVIWSLVAILFGAVWAMALGIFVAIWLLIRVPVSRNGCLTAAIRLVALAGADSGFPSKLNKDDEFAQDRSEISRVLDEFKGAQRQLQEPVQGARIAPTA